MPSTVSGAFKNYLISAIDFELIDYYIKSKLPAVTSAVHSCGWRPIAYPISENMSTYIVPLPITETAGRENQRATL